MLGGLYKFGSSSPQAINPFVPQGGWDANANNPALASGVGNPGDVYIVTTAGSTNLDGNSTWAVGDLVIWDDTAQEWVRIPVSEFWTSYWVLKNQGIAYVEPGKGIGVGVDPVAGITATFGRHAGSGTAQVDIIGGSNDAILKIEMTSDHRNQIFQYNTAEDNGFIQRWSAGGGTFNWIKYVAGVETSVLTFDILSNRFNFKAPVIFEPSAGIQGDIGLSGNGSQMYIALPSPDGTVWRFAPDDTGTWGTV